MRTESRKPGERVGHTPGPWKAGRSDMATIVDGYDSKWVYAGERYIAVASGADVEDWDEVLANAHLIAAAPEMYAALEAVMRLDYFREHNALADIVRAALTKVQGGTDEGE